MILKIFLIFGDLSLDDSYRINSYKKMCIVIGTIHLARIEQNSVRAFIKYTHKNIEYFSLPPLSLSLSLSLSLFLSLSLPLSFSLSLSLSRGQVNVYKNRNP